MIFVYDLPNWVLGLSIVSVVLALSFAGYFVFHRWCHSACTEENKSVAMGILGVVATINSLLLAFSAVSVWESFGNADQAVMAESNMVGALARDLAVYDLPESRVVRGMLRQYVDMVVRVEWPEMREGRASVDTWDHFDRMFAATGRIRADSPTHAVLLPEIWARINDLLQARRTRLYTSQASVPGTLWAVVLVGTASCMLTMYVLPKSGFNLAMIGRMALSIGLVFFFIIAMDRPFAGKESISAHAFETTIENMDRWDATIAPALRGPSSVESTR